MNKLHLLSCFFYVFIILSCSTKDDCVIGELEYPNLEEIDGESYRNNLRECRESKLQTFTFSTSQNIRVIGEQGTQINIPVETFWNSTGDPITQEVTINLLEMYAPSDILSCQLSTNGLNERQGIEPLLSEGFIFFEITDDGIPITINNNSQIQIFIPSNDDNLSLSLFNNSECNALDCEVLWEQEDTPVFFTEVLDSNDQFVTGFQATVSKTGWYNMSRFNPSNNLRGTLYNLVTPGYNQTNSDVYIFYESNSIAIGKYLKFDAENDLFSEEYSEIPEDTPAHIIFMSKKENDYLFEIQSIETEIDLITITRNPIKDSEVEFKNYIDNL